MHESPSDRSAFETWDCPRFKVLPKHAAPYETDDYEEVRLALQIDLKNRAKYWDGRKYIDFCEGDYLAMEVQPR